MHEHPTADRWIVIENTPGYLPDDDDPFETDDYHEACEHAESLAVELEEQGYDCDRSWASSGNYFAISCTRDERDLGRWIAVERVES
jgi:hypothetical protein